MNSSLPHFKRCTHTKTHTHTDSNLWRRKLLRDLSIQHGGQQHISQDLTKVLGHDCLLLHTTVILKGQDDGEV